MMHKDYDKALKRLARPVITEAQGVVDSATQTAIDMWTAGQPVVEEEI